MSKTKNFLRFLDFIVKNGKFCTKEVADLLDLSPRTIQRFKNEIEEFFGARFIQSERGCYLLPSAKRLKRLLLDPKDLQDFEKVFDILALANRDFLRFLHIDDEAIEKLLQDDAKIYKIKETPFEDLVNSSMLSPLKEAIKYQKKIDIHYQSDQDYFYKEAKPLRIVYAEGNWYVAALTNDPINNGFKFLRINFIRSIKLHNKTFHTDYDALAFLDRFQSLFSSYKASPFAVIVQVDKEVARHFRIKRHLPSQKILQDTGDLTIQYTITNENEILLLAKRWLPHMRIIKPQSLQQKLLDLVKKFLSDNS